MQKRLIGNVLLLSFALICAAQSTVAQNSPCAGKPESGLPLPSTFLPARLSQFQAQLKTFLTSAKYRDLKWCEDKKLRDTGPFGNGVSYGVHPTVKIYYSPNVIDWLLHKDRSRLISDGSMIMKERQPQSGSQQAAPRAGDVSRMA
ncbi:MAG TPA: hypothetical protein VFD62_13815 [Pyrinomonadaceae bacterium]|nr:hypothetical protein [Pyrinomonadaceae bacterium]